MRKYSMFKVIGLQKDEDFSAFEALREAYIDFIKNQCQVDDEWQYDICFDPPQPTTESLNLKLEEVKENYSEAVTGPKLCIQGFPRFFECYKKKPLPKDTIIRVPLNDFCKGCLDQLKEFLLIPDNWKYYKPELTTSPPTRIEGNSSQRDLDSFQRATLKIIFRTNNVNVLSVFYSNQAEVSRYEAGNWHIDALSHGEVSSQKTQSTLGFYKDPSGGTNYIFLPIPKIEEFLKTLKYDSIPEANVERSIYLIMSSLNRKFLDHLEENNPFLFKRCVKITESGCLYVGLPTLVWHRSPKAGKERVSFFIQTPYPPPPPTHTLVSGKSKSELKRSGSDISGIRRSKRQDVEEANTLKVGFFNEPGECQ